MTWSRRRFLTGASAGALASTFLPDAASATTLVPFSLEELLERSGLVSLALPVLAESRWETFGGSRRIVTRTRVTIVEPWRSSESEISETEVVTLGGVVGDLAQKVPGEASLGVGRRCVVFLSPETNGGRFVVGMAQGHYRVRGDGDSGRLEGSRDLHFAPRRGTRFARASFDALTVAEARALVRGAKR